MAGFEVTPYGRFCLTPEGRAVAYSTKTRLTHRMEGGWLELARAPSQCMRDHPSNAVELVLFLCRRDPNIRCC